jgi:hypothetical protein
VRRIRDENVGVPERGGRGVIRLAPGPVTSWVPVRGEAAMAQAMTASGAGPAASSQAWQRGPVRRSFTSERSGRRWVELNHDCLGTDFARRPVATPAAAAADTHSREPAEQVLPRSAATRERLRSVRGTDQHPHHHACREPRAPTKQSTASGSSQLAGGSLQVTSGRAGARGAGAAEERSDERAAA